MAAARPDPHVVVALLAGGRGTRFWPLSREGRPKQLVDVTGEGPMAQVTLARVKGLAPPRNVLVVTSADLAAKVGRLLRLPPRAIVAEPSGRNTAAATGLAALVAHVRDPEAVVLALPADHHVGRPVRLRAALRRGVAAARKLGGLVLFGERPSTASTAYGYVVPGRASAMRGVLEVARFREKPPADDARRLVDQGALWNTGMFCFRADDGLRAIAEALPDLAGGLEALRSHVDRPSWPEALRRVHARLPAVSFDHGVLEKVGRLHVVPVDLEWSDVGSWTALADALPADARGNRARGRAQFHEARDCVVVQSPGSKRRVVVLGAQRLLLVDDEDLVFACPLDEVGRIPWLLTRLTKESPDLT